MVRAEVTKLPFKARLCIEGIPRHARQPDIIQRLLPSDTLFEDLDCHTRNVGEASCCCAIVWAQNPDDFTKGVLQLEELSDRPQAIWHFTDLSKVDVMHP
jgi:hypothetical protein